MHRPRRRTLQDEFVCRDCYDRLSAYSIVNFLFGKVWNIVDAQFCSMVDWHPEFHLKKRRF